MIYPFNEEWNIKIYVTTYPSVHQDSLFKIYQPDHHLILEDKKLRMRSTYLKSIDNVINLNVTIIHWVISAKRKIVF